MTQRVRRHSDEDNPDVRQRQSREVDDPDYYVHTRVEDRSLLLRISYYIDKYRLIWYIIIGAAVSFGFDFKTPASANHELKARVDTVNMRVDSMVAENRRASVARDKVDAKIDLLLKFQCLQQSQRDLTIAGVDCKLFGIDPRIGPRQ
jgi:hypothetical protein